MLAVQAIRHVRLRRFLVVIATMVCAQSGGAEPAPPGDVAAVSVTGRIDQVHPADALELGLVTVLRNGVRLPGKPELQPGDVVRVTGGATLTIRMADGKTLLVNEKVAAPSGFVFSPAAPSLFDLVSRVFPFRKAAHTQFALTAIRERVSICSVGSLWMPANTIDGITYFLQSGHRALHFRWFGGRPPYKLSLKQDGRVLAEGLAGDACELTLAGRQWDPGRYAVELADGPCIASGDVSRCAWSEDVTIVSPDRLPPVPPGIAGSGLDAGDRRALYAEFLASIPDAGWQLEAIQQLAPWKDSDRRARDWLGDWGGGRASAPGVRSGRIDP